MKNLAVLLSFVGVVMLPTASAAVVHVTVTGIASFALPQGETYPSSILGNGHFTANFSYEDSVGLEMSNGLYENAVTSFSMVFEGGSVFTAAGGDISTEPSSFGIVSLRDADFPDLAGRSFTGGMMFKFLPSGNTPMDRLPTATEFANEYQPWYSWIFYSNSSINTFILRHDNMAVVPEPSIFMYGASILGLVLCRQRNRV